jgi:hypothetical protein
MPQSRIRTRYAILLTITESECASVLRESQQITGKVHSR